jgi:hypothetical protein
MPFLNPDHKPIIHHPSGHPVDVIATFNPLGQIRIDYFRIEDDTQERFTFKLSKSHLRKDYNHIMTFDCEYIAYDRINRIVLTYDVTWCRWSVG